MTSTNQNDAARASAWSPLRIGVFRALWIATLASNIGTWMHDVGAGWLMTSLSPSPVMVALVQTATTLPIFLLALPAGALSDIVDRRRHLIAAQFFLATVAAVLGAMTLAGHTTAWTLVGLTFASGVGTALMLPAWASITPELVPRDQLQAAIALNSLGINVARAIGPAIAGVVVSTAGTGAVFVLNALSYLGVLAVLVRWQRRPNASSLPSERFFGALRSGLRFARHAPQLQRRGDPRHRLLRLRQRQLGAAAAGGQELPAAAGPRPSVCWWPRSASAPWPGALVLPKIRERVSRDLLVAAASLIYAGTTLALARLVDLPLLCLAMVISGGAWISVLSSLQVARSDGAARLGALAWTRGLHDRLHRFDGRR